MKDFMRKQDLIDATDASGLSHASIAYESQTCSHSLILYSNTNVSLTLYHSCGWFRPEKGKGKMGLGLSKREYYSGWSCMTTLIHKGLVIKYSNPAK